MQSEARKRAFEDDPAKLHRVVAAACRTLRKVNVRAPRPTRRLSAFGVTPAYEALYRKLRAAMGSVAARAEIRALREREGREIVARHAAEMHARHQRDLAQRY